KTGGPLFPEPADLGHGRAESHYSLGSTVPLVGRLFHTLRIRIGFDRCRPHLAGSSKRAAGDFGGGAGSRTTAAAEPDFDRARPPRADSRWSSDALLPGCVARVGRGTCPLRRDSPAFRT